MFKVNNKNTNAYCQNGTTFIASLLSLYFYYYYIITFLFSFIFSLAICSIIENKNEKTKRMR